jgi:hypothetical protein
LTTRKLATRVQCAALTISSEVRIAGRLAGGMRVWNDEVLNSRMIVGCFGRSIQGTRFLLACNLPIGSVIGGSPRSPTSTILHSRNATTERASGALQRPISRIPPLFEGHGYASPHVTAAQGKLCSCPKRSASILLWPTSPTMKSYT